MSFFFESCNKQSGEARPGTGTGAGSGSGSGSGHQLAQVIGLSQITFQPANSELIMQLRRQRLLPPLAPVDGKEEEEEEEAEALRDGKWEEGEAEPAEEDKEKVKPKEKTPWPRQGGAARRRGRRRGRGAGAHQLGPNRLHGRPAGRAERDEQADEESEATIWRHSRTWTRLRQRKEEARPPLISSLPSPPSIASATQRKAIDMQKASRMARGTRKRTKSSLSIPVTMPALFRKMTPFCERAQFA